MDAKLEITTANKPLPMLTVEGEIDHFNCGRVETALHELLGADVKSIAIDLTNAAYVDTAGVAMIFWTAKKLHDRGGNLKIVLPPGDVRRILELAGVGSLPGTVVFDSLSRALD